MIISPQPWGPVRVSKHHYARKLAQAGNTVYYLDPPYLNRKAGWPAVELHPSGEHDSLFIVKNHIAFPYWFKFHLPALFYRLMRRHMKAVIEKIGGNPDIVWSFDQGDVYPLRFFPSACLRIFHPVDIPHMSCGITAARGADIIFSTSELILKRYSHYPIPGHIIEHGLADEFISDSAVLSKREGIRIGYSGNLLRHDIDRKTLLDIIAGFPAVHFDFWGNHADEKADSDTREFIRQLTAATNVTLHGMVPFDLLPAELTNMDAFLICYDLQAENVIGPNYHKLMEYFSTGKTVISSHIGHYAGRPDLVQMVAEQSNERLPALFRQVLDALEEHNSPERRAARIQFARSNTYGRHLERISGILSVLKQDSSTLS